jgi:hypothetical protein
MTDPQPEPSAPVDLGYMSLPLSLAAALGRAEGRLSVAEDVLAAVRQRARDWASIAPGGPQSPVLADAGRWILAIIGTERQTPDVREYRVLIDEDGEQVVLIGPCAETIGCLFHRSYDSPTLGQLIDAATEHEGEQGKHAHAHLAEMAAEWDADAEARNAESAEGDSRG